MRRNYASEQRPFRKKVLREETFQKKDLDDFWHSKYASSVTHVIECNFCLQNIIIKKITTYIDFPFLFQEHYDVVCNIIA